MKLGPKTLLTAKCLCIGAVLATYCFVGFFVVLLVSAMF